MINTKPLIKFLLWTFTLFLLCIIGASNVFGAELSNMKFIGRTFNQYPFSTNYDPSTYNADYFTFNGADTLPNYAVLTTCGTGALGFNITNTTGNFSYIDYISLDNNTCTTQGYQGNQYIYYFKFNKWVDAGNGNFGVSFNNNVTNIYNYNTFVTFNDIKFTDTINLEELKQQQEIINQNNQNTNNIINNQNQNNENLIDSNTQNTQDIINNNDTNTQKIIDSNKENFQSCGSNLLDGINYIQGNILNNGTYNYDTGRVLSDYFKIKQLTYNYEINDNLIFYIISYDYQKNFISRTIINNTSGTFIPTSNTEYLRISFRNTENTAITPDDIKNSSPTFYSENDCTNKLDETNNSINNLDNTLKDDNVDENGIADAFDDFNDFLDDNSTITQLITLPITLYTAILNNLNSSCSPFNLGELYGESLILPCINVSQYLGSSLWTMIDIIISGFAIFAISKKFIKVFNNFSSLREGDVIDD